MRLLADGFYSQGLLDKCLAITQSKAVWQWLMSRPILIYGKTSHLITPAEFQGKNRLPAVQEWGYHIEWKFLLKGMQI